MDDDYGQEKNHTTATTIAITNELSAADKYWILAMSISPAVRNNNHNRVTASIQNAY